MSFTVGSMKYLWYSWPLPLFWLWSNPFKEN